MKHNPLRNPSDWTLVGHFGVDAGLCWIGDPCYIMHTTTTKDGKEVPAPLPATLGKDWGEFCDKLNYDGPVMQSFNYELGHEGLGCLVSTGYGDGSYPVYALVLDEGDWGKRVAALFVDFFGLMQEEIDEPDHYDAYEN